MNIARLRRQPAYHLKPLEKLRFIRSAQSFGLSLKEVSQLYGRTDDDGSPCAGVEQLLERRIPEVRQMVKNLRRVERTLVGALTSC